MITHRSFLLTKNHKTEIYSWGRGFKLEATLSCRGEEGLMGILTTFCVSFFWAMERQTTDSKISFLFPFKIKIFARLEPNSKVYLCPSSERVNLHKFHKKAVVSQLKIIIIVLYFLVVEKCFSNYLTVASTWRHIFHNIHSMLVSGQIWAFGRMYLKG